MAELNPGTFDLGAVLSGQDYPEKTVDVYFNESLAYEVAKANRELNFLDGLNDEKFKEAQDKFDALVESLAEHKYVFHLKAIPSRFKKDIDAQVEAKFPTKFNQIGMPEQNSARDELFAVLMMEAYITKIVAPDGAEVVKPSIETVENFRLNAPRHALALVESEIIAFEQDISVGFETAAKSADFLSKP
jgi:hypothetical protein